MSTFFCHTFLFIRSFLKPRIFRFIYFSLSFFLLVYHPFLSLTFSLFSFLFFCGKHRMTNNTKDKSGSKFWKKLGLGKSKKSMSSLRSEPALGKEQENEQEELKGRRSYL
jgi:hypothetical protein